jgi:hypothetical protein
MGAPATRRNGTILGSFMIKSGAVSLRWFKEYPARTGATQHAEFLGP